MQLNFDFYTPKMDKKVKLHFAKYNFQQLIHQHSGYSVLSEHLCLSLKRTLSKKNRVLPNITSKTCKNSIQFILVFNGLKTYLEMLFFKAWIYKICIR